MTTEGNAAPPEINPSPADRDWARWWVEGVIRWVVRDAPPLSPAAVAASLGGSESGAEPVSQGGKDVVTAAPSAETAPQQRFRVSGAVRVLGPEVLSTRADPPASASTSCWGYDMYPYRGGCEARGPVQATDHDAATESSTAAAAAAAAAAATTTTIIETETDSETATRDLLDSNTGGRCDDSSSRSSSRLSDGTRRISSGEVGVKLKRGVGSSEIVCLEKHPDKPIWQVAVVHQWNPYICGYHALYNAGIVFRVCALCPNLKVSRETLEEIASIPRFQSFICHTQDYLKKEAVRNGNKYFPWTTKDIDAGILEREYLYKIVEDEIFLKDLCGLSPQDITALPDFSQNSVSNSLFEADQASQLYKTFQACANSHNFTHAFVVGSTSHWFCIVVNKTANELEILYLDSNNIPLLSCGPEGIREMVKRRLAGKPTIKPGTEEKSVENLMNIRWIVELICDCSMGHRDFLCEFLTLPWEKLLSSFSAALLNPDYSGDGIAQLIMWIQENYPIPHIASYFSKTNILGKEHIKPATWATIKEWARTLLSSKHLSESTIEEVVRLIQLLHQHESLLEILPTNNVF
ncbi:hypothetical protein Pelo_12597 [Pelomyxa schiedti]|nr:hypothetical protein Pelo_12597 [Pelomyxa schiedti]